MLKPTVIFSVLVMLFSHQLIAGEGSTYNFSWLDPDKEVYVLQNRKYRKDKTIHLNAGYGMTTSGPFVDTKSLQGRVGFFFQEEWGAEFIYAKNSGEENDNALAVRNGTGGGTTPFRRIVDSYMGGVLLWSPFYTKINTFNKIFYLDWIFGLGYGKIEETNNRLEVETSGVNKNPESLSHSGLMWEAAIQAYMSKNLALRLDLTTIHYSATPPTGGSGSAGDSTETNWDLALSLSLRL